MSLLASILSPPSFFSTTPHFHNQRPSHIASPVTVSSHGDRQSQHPVQSQLLLLTTRAMPQGLSISIHLGCCASEETTAVVLGSRFWRPRTQIRNCRKTGHDRSNLQKQKCGFASTSSSMQALPERRYCSVVRRERLKFRGLDALRHFMDIWGDDVKASITSLVTESWRHGFRGFGPIVPHLKGTSNLQRFDFCRDGDWTLDQGITLKDDVFLELEFWIKRDFPCDTFLKKMFGKRPSIEIGMIQEISIGDPSREQVLKVTLSTALYQNANDSPTLTTYSSLSTSREMSDTSSQWKATWRASLCSR